MTAESGRANSRKAIRPGTWAAKHKLRDVVDPLEKVIRGEDAGSSLTGARYNQRTEVFESILKFVVDDEKQPSQSLLDLVERDRCRVDVI